MKIPWNDLVIIGGVAAVAYFMKDTLLSLVGKTGGTSDLPVCTAAMIQAGDPCRVASPFPYLPNDPVVPSGLSYVNPLLCALTGTSCPPDPTTGPAPAPLVETTPTSAFLVGKVNRGECFTMLERDWATHYDPTLLVLQDMAGVCG